MKTLRTLLFAAALAVVGCGGGGSSSTDPPPPTAQKPIGVWEGSAYHDDGQEETLSCLILPGLEVLCATDAHRELDGKIVELVGEEALKIEYEVVPEVDARSLDVTRGEGVIDCEWSPGGTMICDYLGVGDDGVIESGRMVFHHCDNHADEAHSGLCLLRRRVNQQHVAGTWLDPDGPIPFLSIDVVGRAYGHDAVTGCYFNGTLKAVPDTLYFEWDNLNLYEVTLLIESCDASDYEVYNGRTVRGRAFLDDTDLHNDTLKMMSGVNTPEGPAAFCAEFHRQ
jgi:hypothetical protein